MIIQAYTVPKNQDEFEALFSRLKDAFQAFRSQDGPVDKYSVSIDLLTRQDNGKVKQFTSETIHNIKIMFRSTGSHSSVPVPVRLLRFAVKKTFPSPPHFLMSYRKPAWRSTKGPLTIELGQVPVLAVPSAAILKLWVLAADENTKAECMRRLNARGALSERLESWAESEQEGAMPPVVSAASEAQRPLTKGERTQLAQLEVLFQRLKKYDMASTDDVKHGEEELLGVLNGSRKHQQLRILQDPVFQPKKGARGARRGGMGVTVSENRKWVLLQLGSLSHPFSVDNLEYGRQQLSLLLSSLCSTDLVYSLLSHQLYNKPGSDLGSLQQSKLHFAAPKSVPEVLSVLSAECEEYSRAYKKVSRSLSKNELDVLESLYPSPFVFRSLSAVPPEYPGFALRRVLVKQWNGREDLALVWDHVWTYKEWMKNPKFKHKLRKSASALTVPIVKRKPLENWSRWSRKQDKISYYGGKQTTAKWQEEFDLDRQMGLGQGPPPAPASPNKAKTWVEPANDGWALGLAVPSRVARPADEVETELWEPGEEGVKNMMSSDVKLQGSGLFWRCRRCSSFNKETFGSCPLCGAVPPDAASLVPPKDPGATFLLLPRAGGAGRYGDAAEPAPATTSLPQVERTKVPAAVRPPAPQGAWAAQRRWDHPAGTGEADRIGHEETRSIAGARDNPPGLDKLLRSGSSDNSSDSDTLDELRLISAYFVPTALSPLPGSVNTQPSSPFSGPEGASDAETGGGVFPSCGREEEEEEVWVHVEGLEKEAAAAGVKGGSSAASSGPNAAAEGGEGGEEGGGTEESQDGDGGKAGSNKSWFFNWG